MAYTCSRLSYIHGSAMINQVFNLIDLLGKIPRAATTGEQQRQNADVRSRATSRPGTIGTALVNSIIKLPLMWVFLSRTICLGSCYT